MQIGLLASHIRGANKELVGGWDVGWRGLWREELSGDCDMHESKKEKKAIQEEGTVPNGVKGAFTKRKKYPLYASQGP